MLSFINYICFYRVVNTKWVLYRHLYFNTLASILPSLMGNKETNGKILNKSTLKIMFVFGEKLDFIIEEFRGNVSFFGTSLQ